MTSITNTKKPCSKCGSEGWVLLCDGCHASFCIKHAGDHRTELGTQLDNIQEQFNHLQCIHTEHEKCQEHPLFSQIDVWEHDTTAKIIQIAQIARDELRQFLDESNNRMKTLLNQFNDQLRNERQHERFTEIEINQWKDQLINIKKQLETPCDIELIPDKDSPPIHLIKINKSKLDTSTQNPLLSEENPLCEDVNDTKCSSDNELDKPLSSNSENTTECTSSSEQNESSVTSKEEPLLNLNLRDIPEIEYENPFDPTKNNRFVLIQLSPSPQSKLLEIHNQLTNHALHIIEQIDGCLDTIQLGEQTTIFIDLFETPLDEQRCILDNLSQLNNVYSIYIRGIPSEDDNERSNFFRRYSKIKAVFNNEQRLMVQWAIDTANEYKKTGDMYVKIGDKNKGRECFQEGVNLYRNLSEFLNKKRCVR